MTNLDDPNLTAYALGELPEQERAAMESAIAKSSDAQLFVRQTQQLAGLLRDDFRFELERAARPLNVMPFPAPRSFFSDARWMSIGVAALLALAALIAAVVLSPNGARARRHLANEESPGEVQMEFETELEAALDAASGPAGENPFLSVATNPVSALSFNVRRESYENIRRHLANGKLPPRALVQLEGLINHFPYDYPAPKSIDTFGLELTATGCPWLPEHRLVRVAVKARAPAQRVQLLVKFEATSVESYRLLGYEDHQASGSTSGSERGSESRVQAGQTLTALYEILPAATASPAVTPNVSATLIYYPSDGSTKFVMQDSALKDFGNDFENAPADFKFAAAVAEFGMILRDSPYKGNGTLGTVLEWSNESKGRDETGARAGFVELVRQAQALAL